jgi:hypothetical protein
MLNMGCRVWSIPITVLGFSTFIWSDVPGGISPGPKGSDGISVFMASHVNNPFLDGLKIGQRIKRIPPLPFEKREREGESNGQRIIRPEGGIVWTD